MACALTPESRRLYSWWWDSHISPKNSRWLQENLTDMDTKVKSMIKLIEEDADSFARRAEMYYKKRPELMKLVEQFYRAYRALAERYDHATNELRHAQKALQAAFPDQEPFTFPEDSSSSIEPDAIKHESFGLQLFGEDECEVERLKKVVADLIAEKDSLYVLYQYSLGKLANADEELACARERSRILEEKGNEAGKEVHKLKETLGVTNQTEHLATITDLKEKINTLDKRALAGLKYREMTSVLEKTIVVTEEMEVEKLKAALLELTEEKEVLRVLYAECLEKSYVLERDLSLAQSDVQRLTTEIVNSSEKLKHVEEICVHLETSNQYLKMEVSDLAKKIMFQDQELSDKHDELKNTEVEVVALQRMKERLEEEVVLKSGQFTAMQKEIFDLKEEITKLNVRSNSLTGPLELTCLNPESVEDENSRLITDLQSSCESLHVEKSNFILEKSILSSQLHVTTINMQTLLDQKTVLENSLSAANIELENLRERSKGLEELCELLKNEKSNLFVESVQKRLEVLENRFMQFEKEKETGNSRMLELVSSTVKKQEHKNQIVMSQKRLDDLENKLKKAEFQDELDKAVIAQFENFILHKFVLEVEEENYCLSVENRKHIEASKLADNLISELEREILEQQVEEELLLVEVENLRSGINKVFLSLGIGSNPAKISTEEIMDNIMDLKHCLLKEENIKHRLLIENNVISTFLMNKYEAMKDDLFKIKKENLDLIEVNENLGLELVILDEEIEERETVQQNLASELQEREKELEVSKSEAAKLIFDLQVSNTRDIVFESKVHELAAFCESLKGESAAKDLEIEEMKRKASIMEKEIEGLKAQLLAYTPVIGSLKENISSLEQNFFAVANLVVSNSRKAQDVELKVHPHHNQRDPEVTRGRKSFEPNGISDLIEFQTRIAALEKVIEKDINTAARCKTSAINFKQKPAKPETEESKSNDHQKRNKEEKIHRKQRYLTLDPLNISDVRDIPLDQASDGSSSAKSRSRSRRGYLRSDGMLIEQLQASRNSSKRYANKLPYEPQIEDLSIYRLPPSNQEHKKVKLLQRLASDAHKLENLESTVKDLTKRLEAGKRSKKQNGVDLKIVKEQLEQAEETISHLANVNIESTANVEKNTSLAAWLEQDDPWKRSERIKTVQLDVQNIQCVLMKLDDEKKCKMKSRFSMSKSRTSVILRDFIHHGGRSRRRRLCGCFTPSLSKSDHVKS